MTRRATACLLACLGASACGQNDFTGRANDELAAAPSRGCSGVPEVVARDRTRALATNGRELFWAHEIWRASAPPHYRLWRADLRTLIPQATSVDLCVDIPRCSVTALLADDETTYADLAYLDFFGDPGWASYRFPRGGAPEPIGWPGSSVVALDDSSLFFVDVVESWPPPPVSTTEASLWSVPKQGGLGNRLLENDNMGSLVVDERYLYGTNGQAVMRMAKTGGAQETLASGFTARPVAIAVDAFHVFAAEGNDGSIWSLPKLGGAATRLVPPDATRHDIEACALTNDFVYWLADGGLWRVAKVGGAFEWVALGGGALVGEGDAVYFTTTDAVMRLCAREAPRFAAPALAR